MYSNELDLQVRLAAFDFLEKATQLHREALPRKLLEQGFQFRGQRVPLISPQGIFTPKILNIPLTFCTVPPSLKKVRPYDDNIDADGMIKYRYRGTDPKHRDNAGLRHAMEQQIPLIYLLGTVPGKYRPVWPVYIVGDNPQRLTFDVMVDDKSTISAVNKKLQIQDSDEKRRYITVETQRRLHQAGFRDRVLSAYHGRCAICQLHHSELLEAAHILPDKHPLSEPIISNGLALCKIHHATFDLNITGITPDYVVEVRKDILEEHDGPMLKHGIQELQGQNLYVPRISDFKPNREFLAIRYEVFEKAG